MGSSGVITFEIKKNSMRHLIIFFVCFATITTNAQNSKFDSLMRGITFNVYSDTPDSIILPFLKNHLPYLAKHPEAGGWTVYPPGAIPIPQKGMHSLRVDKHPFINTKHKGARIDFLTQEWKEGPPGLAGMRVWIYFGSKAEAESAINEIIKKFQKAAATVEHVIHDKKEKTIIKNGNQWESLSIVLQKVISTNDYSILILFYDDDGQPW